MRIMETKYTETKVVPIARKEKTEIHKKSILFSFLDSTDHIILCLSAITTDKPAILQYGAIFATNPHLSMIGV